MAKSTVIKQHRKIPATMATQHPDHAARPFWHTESFIPAIEEARELFLSFADLGISEYMWDWEGKLVDESVLERLLAKQFEYFKNNPIGKDKFLTFRLPDHRVAGVVERHGEDKAARTREFHELLRLGERRR